MAAKAFSVAATWRARVAARRCWREIHVRKESKFVLHLLHVHELLAHCGNVTAAFLRMLSDAIRFHSKTPLAPQCCLPYQSFFRLVRRQGALTRTPYERHQYLCPSFFRKVRECPLPLPFFRHGYAGGLWPYTTRLCPPAQFQVRRTSAMHRPTKAIMEAVRITDSHAFCYQRDCTASGNIPTTKAYLMLSSWCPPFQGLRGLSPLSVSLFALLGVWGGSSPPVPRVCATPSIIWYGWARSLQERAPLLCSGALRAGTPYPPLS